MSNCRFKLPIAAKNNQDYVDSAEDILRKFSKCVFDQCNLRLDTKKEVNRNCEMIILALKDLMNHKIEEADKKIEVVLQSYIENTFAVSELDNSYAFRGVSRYDELHAEYVGENFYKKMKETELSFYRARVVNKSNKLCGIKDIMPLPYSKRNLSRNLRFSVENEVCLYLSTTTFCCAAECGWDDAKQKDHEIYFSAFKFDKGGKILKILNLVVSEPMINGIGIHENISKKFKLYDDLVKIFPLVLVTSFTVEDEEENRKKIEYLISQSIIRVIKYLHIDGVAYLSKRGVNDLQYPHGVNLVIPMKDIHESKEYSDLCNCFSCTKPIVMSEISLQNKWEKRSYINECYPKYDTNGCPSIISRISYKGKGKFYGDTLFSQFDDYLWNQKFYSL